MAAKKDNLENILGWALGVKIRNCGTYISTWGSNFQTYQCLLTGSCFGRSKQNSGFRGAKVLGWGYMCHSFRP